MLRRKEGCLYHGGEGGFWGVEDRFSPVPTVRGRVEVRRRHQGKRNCVDLARVGSHGGRWRLIVDVRSRKNAKARLSI